MSRIVTALFASRGEAEVARARLASTVKVESARIVSQDTAGALIGLPIDAKQTNVLREALSHGDHVVVATVARGADAAQIVSALSDVAAEEASDDGPKLSYSIGPPAAGAVRPREPHSPARVPAMRAPSAGPASNSPTRANDTQAEVEPTTQAISSLARDAPEHDQPPPQTAPAEVAAQEVRIGDGQLFHRGNTRTTGLTKHPGFESRAPARRLTDEEVQAGGLLKDRVIEVVEMREEPVISREVVVREEVLIRKTVNERSETIKDSVRRTEVDIEELQSRD